MEEVKIECEHDWMIEDDNKRWHIRGCGETVERDYVCVYCGLKAREIWLYSCMMDENDKEI